MNPVNIKEQMQRDNGAGGAEMSLYPGRVCIIHRPEPGGRTGAAAFWAPINGARLQAGRAGGLGCQPPQCPLMTARTTHSPVNHRCINGGAKRLVNQAEALAPRRVVFQGRGSPYSRCRDGCPSAGPGVVPGFGRADPPHGVASSSPAGGRREPSLALPLPPARLLGGRVGAPERGWGAGPAARGLERSVADTGILGAVSQ